MTYRTKHRRAMLAERATVIETPAQGGRGVSVRPRISYHAAPAAPHQMRTARTTLGSLRSSNPAIRRAAQTAALRLGLIERADGTREG